MQKSTPTLGLRAGAGNLGHQSARVTFQKCSHSNIFYENCWKNIFKNMCNYALLRNCALKLSSLYSNLTDDH